MDRKAHWEHVYASKTEREVSWFEPVPAVSIRLIESAGLTAQTCVVDIGGGDSRLIDHLSARGLHCLTVLDISGAALRRAQARLGEAAAAITWIDADVTGEWSMAPVDIWHDRAVFHFLTDAGDRARYRERLRQFLKVNGSAILAVFALNGPERCSGLPITRYSVDTLAAELGQEFRLVESVLHEHRTPWDAIQPFSYARFLRLA